MSTPACRGPLILAGFLLLPLVNSAAGEGIRASDCRPCHRQLYDSYIKTPMGRSFYVPTAAPVIEDWKENNHFYHAPSDRYYEMLRREDGFYVRRYQLGQDGRPTNVLERRVTHIMGSGERAHSYLHRSTDGRMIELPVSWYSQENAWAMAPGYDRARHKGFTRQVTHKCMFCHNAYPDVPAERSRQGWDADARFPAELPMGIDCRRCHGPGAEHIGAASRGDATAARDLIVNPAKLSPERRLDVCMQCHLETTTFRLPESYRRFGRSFYSYEPGEPLGDYIVHFDHAPGTGHDDKFEIVSAAYRLRQSACFQASSGELTCTTCHNPHSTVRADERTEHYRERCLGCHQSASVESRHDLPGFANADCTACHMPLRRTEDVVHVAMTDHRIQRHKPAGDLLAPRREKTDEQQKYRGKVVLYYPSPEQLGADLDLYLGIAQVKEKANLQKGQKLLAAALKKRNVVHVEPYFELAEAQAALGKTAKAEAAYRKAIERDPAHVQARNNLANLLADTERFDEAIVLYRSALELDPSAADVHNNLGLALLAQRNPQAALEAFQASVKANPMYAEAHLNLGSLLLSAAQLAGARKFLETALQIEPSLAEAHHNLGLLHMTLGNRERARDYLKFALRNGEPGLQESAEGFLKQLE